jgi:glycogen debranching enzyme
VAYYAFNDTALLANGLKQFARAQRKDGSIPGLYPAGEEKMVPDFALLWVFSVLDYYAFSGDAALVGELYPNVRRLLEWFLRNTDQDGLLCDVPGNVFIDWKEIDGKGNLTALNCLYYHALRVAAFVAEIAGRSSDVEEILAKAASLKSAIVRFLYNSDRGLYATSRVDGKLLDEFDPQTNILAALCDLTDQYQRAAIFRWVSDCPVNEIATPYFASFVLEALYLADRHEDALQYMTKRWQVMVADASEGATLWEEFTSDGGLCQGWSSAPVRDLIAEYVGIKPAMVSRRFSVTPHTAGLAWAKGSIATECGPLSVMW